MNRLGDTLIHWYGNEPLIKELIKNNAEFILIGGLAVAWYCSERQADDMDILVNPTEENSTSISMALTNLHINGHNAHSFEKLSLQVPLKNGLYADILTPKEGSLSFNEILNEAIDAKIFNLPVKLASLKTLISLKEHAISTDENNAEKHTQDIMLLKRYDV